MADIRVERKGRSVWPWIVGLVVLALLIWAVMEMVEGNQAEMVDEDPVATGAPAAGQAPERDGAAQ